MSAHRPRSSISQWLEAWYGAFAGVDDVEPLIAIVSDAATGEQAALLPLIRRRQNGIRIVEFADLDLTDYNAPLLGTAAPRDAKAARAMWRDLRAALRRLPGGADLIRLRKMPVDLDGRPNPLALLDGAGPCSLNGNVVTTGDDFDAWRYHARTHRAQGTGAKLARVHARSRARRSGSSPTSMKRCAFSPPWRCSRATRMQHLGLNFILNDETCAAFYRNLVARRRRQRLCRAVGADRRRGGGRDPARHPQRLALCHGAHQQCRREMVELLAGPADHRAHHGRAAQGRRAASSISASAIMPTSAASAWRRLRWSILARRLSWRGLPYALRDRAARWLRRHPHLDARIKRALGTPPSREEK